MPVVLHALPEADWAAAQRAGEYHPDSLDEEGYIPFLDPAAVVDAVDERFAGQERDDISVFALRTENLGDSFRYEGENGAEARLYRSIATDAVVDWGPLPRDRHGFHLPQWVVDVAEPGRLPDEYEGEFR